MKRIFIGTTFFLSCFLINAQIISLHNEGNMQLFKGNTAFAQAYDLSQNGDTLYFSGGTFFPPATLNKELTLFGAGHYQDSTIVTGKTIISGDLNLVTGADNFYIEGFQISGRLQVGNNNTINGLTCKRNYITQTINFLGNQDIPCSNIAIIGSIFSGGNFENAENMLVSNCIISNGNINNSHGNIFNNNIILWSSSSHTTYLFNYSNNNNISNNIIQREGSYLHYIMRGDGNVLNNNVFSNAEPSVGTNSTLSNNHYGIILADLFINQASSTFEYSHNYHLQDEALYLGSDGKQVGIYGGAFPYKEGAVPKNPHIMEMNISDTTNEQGELPVKIKVSTQKEQD